MPKSTRRPGRPRRTPEEREAAQERRIAPSYEGRLRFRPGDPHALDVQTREARNYRALLAAQIERLQACQAALDALEDPGVVMSQEEHQLKAYLWQEYQHHKHRDHIAATWLVFRRQRQLARLYAVEEALRIATDLLAPDPSLLDELRQAVEDYTRQQEESASIDAIVLDERHLYGDVHKHRAQLEAFKAQVETMRAGMSPAKGWFEIYYVWKTRYTQLAREYLKHGVRIPDTVQIFEEVCFGPYLKYRWDEDGHQYTIQMSLIPEHDDDEPYADPWPNL